jgi:hypothetical protein
MAIFSRENEPILVCKNMSLERHRAFCSDEFMLVEHFRRSKAPKHVQAIRELVEHADRTKKSLHYFGSYTTDPNIRADKEFSLLLKAVFLSMYVNFHKTYGVDIITGAGAKRFKVDQMLKLWGYEPLKLRGEFLPDYNPACIFGHEAAFFQTERFSDYSYSVAKTYQALWDNRLHFGELPDSMEVAA